MTTVVISRDRREALLESLGRHTGPVVLVDNGSTDGTVEAVRQAHPHVVVVALGRNAGAPARNVGVRLAATPYVAFADDDSFWTPGSLDHAADLFDAHPRLALVAGRVLVGPERRLDGVSAQMEQAPFGTPPGAPGPAVDGFMACGAVVRRSAFLAVGGFDEVVHFPGEEERVSLDLAAAGTWQCYVPAVTAVHLPSPIRSDPERRRHLVTRNGVLTAVMRLPWAEVARRAADGVRSGGGARTGVVAALPRVPAALASRRSATRRCGDPATEPAPPVSRAASTPPAPPAASPATIRLPREGTPREALR